MRPARLSLVLLVFPMTGCSVFDPDVRPGALKIDDVPTVNAASMIANPYDMRRGHGSTVTDGQIAAMAVDRARTDSVKPLLQSSGGASSSSSGNGSSGGGGEAAAPSSAGAGTQ